MRSKCHCGAQLVTLPENAHESGPVYRCANGHFLTNPGGTFPSAWPGNPVAFWMPRAEWEALPVYTGELYGGHTLYRDPELTGVVHRWIGHWWQATLSFEPSPPARMPY